jgi:hypothetical protein
MWLLILLFNWGSEVQAQTQWPDKQTQKTNHPLQRSSSWFAPCNESICGSWLGLALSFGSLQQVIKRWEQWRMWLKYILICILSLILRPWELQISQTGFTLSISFFHLIGLAQQDQQLLFFSFGGTKQSSETRIFQQNWAAYFSVYNWWELQWTILANIKHQKGNEAFFLNIQHQMNSIDMKCAFTLNKD